MFVTSQKLLLSLVGLTSFAQALEQTCSVVPTIVDEPAETLYEDDIIKVITQTSDSIVFSVGQTWSDDVLCLISTHYNSNTGEVCPMNPNAGPGEIAQYTAVCVDGVAMIGIYAYDPSFSTTGPTIPGVCEQTIATSTYQYLYEIPCGPADNEEHCTALSCAEVADITYSFSTAEEREAWLFGGTSSQGYLQLDSSTLEVSKTFEIPSDSTGFTYSFTVLSADLPETQKLYARVGLYYFNLSSKLGKTDGDIDEDYFGEALVKTSYDDSAGALTFTIIDSELFKDTGRVTLGVRAVGGGSIAIHSVSVSIECAFTLPPIFDDGDKDCGGGGDPHFQRWGRAHSSFHGECDLVMIHSEQFHDNAGLDLHVRTTIEDYFSYIESAALRLGDTILEFHKEFIYVGDVKVTPDMLPLTFGDDFKYTISNAELGPSKSPLYFHYYQVDLDRGSSILFKFYKHYLTFSVTGKALDFSDSQGLMGDFGQGEMMGRNGKLITDFDDFGFEWQVLPSDHKLFREDRSPQLPFERCRMPTAARPSRRNLRGDRKLYDLAMKACDHIRGSDFDLCVDDVTTTGDVGLAALW